MDIAYIIRNLINIFLLFIISISLRAILEINSQNWIKTKSHTTTIVILPIVTYVITSVISGNIALSLGLVGALSIVRFRNPVRSPLELTVYFTVITMGIAASVSTEWLIFFAFTIYSSTFLLFIISIFYKKYFKKTFFINSFSEGNSIPTLQIKTSSKIQEIENSIYLKSISYSRDEHRNYLLACNDFIALKEFILKIQDNNLIINYQLNEC